MITGRNLTNILLIGITLLSSLALWQSVPVNGSTAQPDKIETVISQPTAATSSNSAPWDWSNVASQATGALVRIEAVREGTTIVSSGVIVAIDPESDESFVLTNTHVAEGAEELTIISASGARYMPVLVAWDKKLDLIMYKFCCEKGLEYLPVFTGATASPGSAVLAAGFPMGDSEQPTFTNGIVSLLSHNDELNRDEIQMDATLNSGSSGGALINSNGCLVGINTYMILKIGQGSVSSVGIAISSKTIWEFLIDSPIAPVDLIHNSCGVANDQQIVTKLSLSEIA